jgi:hypothetical protein
LMRAGSAWKTGTDSGNIDPLKYPQKGSDTCKL